MSTQAMTSTKNRQALSESDEKNQYTVGQMLPIWAVVTLSMVLLNWVIPTIVIAYSHYIAASHIGSTWRGSMLCWPGRTAIGALHSVPITRW